MTHGLNIPLPKTGVELEHGQEPTWWRILKYNGTTETHVHKSKFPPRTSANPLLMRCESNTYPAYVESESKVLNLPLLSRKQFISPFRYPGGKSWLAPRFGRWIGRKVGMLVEPFVGGGSISLHALSENLAEHVLMCELDPNIAALWKTILGPNCELLIERILEFKPSIDEIKTSCQKHARSTDDLAWQTLLRNRFSFGGLMVNRSSFLKRGDRNKGFASRWYPKTLVNRIRYIYSLRHRIDFRQADGLDVLSSICPYAHNLVCFADPPYPKAGLRLYSTGDFEHERLFALLAVWPGRFLLTYEDSDSIRGLAARYNFRSSLVTMHSRSHQRKKELLISNS